MISALEARDYVEKKAKRDKELYDLNFPAVYAAAQTKLELSIQTATEYGHTQTHIMIHDINLAEQLERECIQLGYKVKYNPKEKTFKVEW